MSTTINQTSSDTTSPAPTDSRVGLALLALAIGGFAIGTTEFVAMGLLPEIADGVKVSIPQAGHVISAYAIGVVVGAPLIAAFGAKVGRKRLLLGMMIVFAIGNILSASAPNFEMLLGARFIAGLPHGAFFGIGAVVAASMVPPNRRAWTISMMMIGLPISNIIGVPLTTLMGQNFGWRTPFMLVTVLAALTLGAVWLWVRPQAAVAGANFKTELSALARPQVWMALLIGMVGFGGMFATYSYITPTMTTLTGFTPTQVTFVLAVFGVGMTLGTVAGGRLTDRALMPTMYGGLLSLVVVLGMFGFLAHTKPGALIAVGLLGFSSSLLIPTLQTRLMDVAQDGQSLAAALNQSTLNVANAIGAALGGLVLAAGYSYEWPSRVGALLAFGGLILALISGLMDRGSPRRGRSS